MWRAIRQNCLLLSQYLTKRDTEAFGEKEEEEEKTGIPVIPRTKHDFIYKITPTKRTQIY